MTLSVLLFDLRSALACFLDLFSSIKDSFHHVHGLLLWLEIRWRVVTKAVPKTDHGRSSRTVNHTVCFPYCTEIKRGSNRFLRKKCWVGVVQNRARDYAVLVQRWTSGRGAAALRSAGEVANLLKLLVFFLGFPSSDLHTVPTGFCPSCRRRGPAMAGTRPPPPVSRSFVGANRNHYSARGLLRNAVAEVHHACRAVPPSMGILVVPS